MIRKEARDESAEPGTTRHGSRDPTLHDIVGSLALASSNVIALVLSAHAMSMSSGVINFINSPAG